MVTVWDTSYQTLSRYSEVPTGSGDTVHVVEHEGQPWSPGCPCVSHAGDPLPCSADSVLRAVTLPIIAFAEYVTDTHQSIIGRQLGASLK